MKIREANEGDLDFLTWVMLAASRSHLDRGVWEWINDQDEEQTLAYLRKVATSDVVHLCHWSLFLIAEVDGIPAAAMCNYVPETQGGAQVMDVMATAAAEFGVVFDDAFMQRVGGFAAVASADEPGALVIENVATRPEFRRQGLTAALLDEFKDRTRDQGYALSKISVFIGNEPARKAYLKSGYEYTDEKRDPVWEAGMGCPGMERLLQTLTDR